jgi:hypothetical protein
MAAASSKLQGRSVDDGEDLYRALTVQKWWKEEENRVSTAAFSHQSFFSVYVASVAKSPEAVLRNFDPGTGLVAFNCGRAKQCGCVDVRLEKDEQDPDNEAHAHVYTPSQNTERKRVARRLVEICTLIVKPSLAAPD